MKQTLTKGLALFLACLMLISVFASCTDGETEVPTDTEAGTESTSESGTEGQETVTEAGESVTETEAATTEGNTEETTQGNTEGTTAGSTETTETATLNYVPVELESKVDMAPNYKEYEVINKDYLEPYSVVVEGENFTASSVPASKTSASNASGGFVFYSGGHVPAEWTQEGFDISKYEKNFDIVYEITIPASGYYKLITHAGDRNHYATTDFSVIIDNNAPVHVLNGKVTAEVPHIGNSTLGELFQTVDMGVFYLKRGEHRITFRMDNEDGYTDQRSADEVFRRICFMMDYFELNRVYSDNDAPVVSYDVDISNDANVDILKEAAEMNVFDARYPIQIDYIHFFEEAGRGNYTITDHAGNVIYRKYFTGEQNDIRKVEIGIKDHPTGYFKLQAGDYVEYYLVMPALDKRTVTDSPFALDTALTQRVANLDRIESYSAIYRMLGITWVRERMAWSSYQPGTYNKETGEYTYTYDEVYSGKIKDRLTVIKDKGLNVLLTFSTGPQWAKDIAKALPGSQVTDGNYLGTYGTQLPAYEATKKLAADFKDVVDIIELMNEPDHTFRDIAEQYSGWFKSAALGVIDSGADMAISIAGFCQPTNWKDFFALVMTSDIMNYSSIYNFHSHKDLPSDVSVPDYGEAVTMKNFPQSLDLLGITKPIWISESGMKLPSENPTDVHLQKQAPYIVTSAIQAISYGVDKYFWFLGAHYLEAGGDYGSFSKNDRAYPVMAAYGIMTYTLGEAKYIGELNDLPDGMRGYLFDTGERVVAVVWKLKGTSAYTFNADAPVLITSMMGEQKLRTPNDKGTISVNVSTEPIYITYSVPPQSYYAHSYEEPDEIVQPTVDFGDRVIITPEFVGHIFDVKSKESGHKIGEGSVINVRVVNHNEVAVTGKINVAIPGFTIEGLDTVVTVQPHEEEFITLTLRKTGPEIFDDHVTFTGKFWDASKTEADGVACSPTAVNVYATEEVVSRSIGFFVSGSLQTGTKIDPEVMKSTIVYIEGFKDGSTVKVNINGKEFTDFTLVEDTSGDKNSTATVGRSMILTMDLSDLKPGKYMIYIGVISAGGDLQVQGMCLRYDGETARYTLTW